MPAVIFHPLSTPATHQLSITLAGHLSALPAHATTRWYYLATSGPLDVTPGTEADALVAKMFERLGDKVGLKNHQCSGSTFEKIPVRAMMVWSTSSERLATKFSLLNWQGDLYAFVSGETDSFDEGVHPWLDALRFALSNINVHPPHAWQALIGVDKTAHGTTHTICMDRFTCADMSGKPLAFEFEEAVPLEGCLGGHRTVAWQPYVVTGSTVGHNWRAASATAREDLHLLCALLTVQANLLWRLRQQPHPTVEGDLTLPEETTSLRRVPRMDAELAAGSTLGVGWQLQRLWETCREDQECAALARAFYEAVRMSEHPSFALMGFVGVIESVGAKLVPTHTPEKCGSCGKPRTSSAAQRFRDALALVLPTDRVKVVADRLYKWRSGTAHAGRLHATETLFGFPPMSESMMVEDARSLFMVRGSFHAQQIARDLLIHLLQKGSVSPDECAAIPAIATGTVKG